MIISALDLLFKDNSKSSRKTFMGFEIYYVEETINWTLLQARWVHIQISHHLLLRLETKLA